MLSGLKERLGRNPKEAKPNPRIWLNDTISIEVQKGIYDHCFGLLSNKYALKEAAEKGVRPLTLPNVLRQIEPDLHQNLIFFDASPSLGRSFANHFRLKEEDGKQRLQACAPNGFWDTKGVLPFEIPEDFAMFTGGIIIVAKRDNGELVPLGEAQEYWHRQSSELLLSGMSEIHYRGEIVMWSNSEGKIRPQLELPLAA